MGDKQEDLKSFAGKACIDIYMSIHVSSMRNYPEPIKKAWSIGQELYLLNKPEYESPELIND